MNTSLQRLRDLLPFAQPLTGCASGPLSAGGLPDAAAGGAPALLAQLGNEVLPAIARQGDPAQRFRQLEAVREEAEPALAELEGRIGAAPLPLPAAVHAAALQADNLIKRLAQGYAELARELAGNPPGDVAPLLYRATQRAMATLARRQLLACRACATPSASSWRQLHALYRMTCDPRRRALNGDTAPIEHEYLGALLLAYLDPNRQPRGELAVLHRCAQQLAAYAVVAEATSEALAGKNADTCFVLRADDGHPGIPLSRLTEDCPLSGGLIIDCTQVLAALDRNLARQPDKAVQPDLAAPPALLRCLRVAIGGRNARRFSRTRFRPRADLVGGLAPAIEFLGGNTYVRRALDAAEAGGARPIAASEWSLINESPDGFLIRSMHGEQCAFSAGQVVVLLPRESSRIHVCLVRRVAAARNRLELGLQLLSPQASVVTLPDDGGRAIFLHSLPAYGPFSGLIAAPGATRSQQRLSLQVLGRPVERQVGRVLEANEGLEFVTLEPLPH
ncbi:MAG TPA: hypothetical protein VF096_03985 [Azonexus sp.]